MMELFLTRIILIFFRYFLEMLRLLLPHKSWPIIFQFLMLSLEIRSLALVDIVTG